MPFAIWLLALGAAEVWFSGEVLIDWGRCSLYELEFPPVLGRFVWQGGIWVETSRKGRMLTMLGTQAEGHRVLLVCMIPACTSSAGSPSDTQVFNVRLLTTSWILSSTAVPHGQSLRPAKIGYKLDHFWDFPKGREAIKAFKRAGSAPC